MIIGETAGLQTAADCAVVPYGAGQAVFIPAGVAHRVANTAPHDARGDSPDVCRK